MNSETIRHRSDLINTQVITRDTGKKLGVVKEILVDVDRREVVALGLRDNVLALAGMPKYMLLENISQMGDVILVENEDVIEDLEVEAYSKLINSEVITETGEPLGRVRGFKFNQDNGQVISLIIGSIGLPLVPENLISTYELTIEEIVSSGPNRLIVFEGSEERLRQLSVGLLERLGLGKAPWEKDPDEAYFPTAVRPENQLPSGAPIKAAPAIKRNVAPIEEDYWEEEEEELPYTEPARRREPEPMYYEAEVEEDNWSEATPSRSPQYSPKPIKNRYEDEDEEDDDYWKDDDETSNNKPLNIPQKTKIPEPQYDE